jgi:hypothetical protein
MCLLDIQDGGSCDKRVSRMTCCKPPSWELHVVDIIRSLRAPWVYVGCLSRNRDASGVEISSDLLFKFLLEATKSTMPRIYLTGTAPANAALIASELK